MGEWRNEKDEWQIRKYEGKMKGWIRKWMNEWLKGLCEWKMNDNGWIDE